MFSDANNRVVDGIRFAYAAVANGVVSAFAFTLCTFHNAMGI